MTWDWLEFVFHVTVLIGLVVLFRATVRLRESNTSARESNLVTRVAIEGLLAAQTRLCPYVETSDEGTSFCRLASNITPPDGVTKRGYREL